MNEKLKTVLAYAVVVILCFAAFFVVGRGLYFTYQIDINGKQLVVPTEIGEACFKSCNERVQSDLLELVDKNGGTVCFSRPEDNTTVIPR